MQRGSFDFTFFERNKTWNKWNIGTKLIKPTFLLEHYRNNRLIFWNKATARRNVHVVLSFDVCVEG